MLCDPDMVLSELRALRNDTVWMGEEELSGKWREFVGYRFVADGVEDGWVSELDGKVGCGGSIKVAGVGDGCRSDLWRLSAHSMKRKEYTLLSEQKAYLVTIAKGIRFI